MYLHSILAGPNIHTVTNLVLSTFEKYDLHSTVSGKISREKSFVNINDEKYGFHRENFRILLTFAVPKDATPPNFAEKTFVNSHKTAKFTKVFSLESFPLYSKFSKSTCFIFAIK